MNKLNENQIYQYRKAADEALDELLKARIKFNSFNSGHEGYGVILEELDELWDEIKSQNHKRDKDKMRKEAMQVAAMALAFMVDICEGDFRK